MGKNVKYLYSGLSNIINLGISEIILSKIFTNWRKGGGGRTSSNRWG